jgi:hypothetical protein
MEGFKIGGFMQCSKFSGLWKIPNLVLYEMSKFGGLWKERGEHPFNFFFLSIKNDFTFSIHHLLKAFLLYLDLVVILYACLWGSNSKKLLWKFH